VAEDETTPLTTVNREIPCPSCDYDLRGLEAGRCPECGVSFDPVELAARPPLRIAWVRRLDLPIHRRFAMTVWQAVFRPAEAFANFEHHALHEHPRVWTFLSLILLSKMLITYIWLVAWFFLIGSPAPGAAPFPISYAFGLFIWGLAIPLDGIVIWSVRILLFSGVCASLAVDSPQRGLIRLGFVVMIAAAILFTCAGEWLGLLIVAGALFVFLIPALRIPRKRFKQALLYSFVLDLAGAFVAVVFDVFADLWPGIPFRGVISSLGAPMYLALRRLPYSIVVSLLLYRWANHALKSPPLVSSITAVGTAILLLFSRSQTGGQYGPFTMAWQRWLDWLVR
jgi:hypothetical protein